MSEAASQKNDPTSLEQRVKKLEIGQDEIREEIAELADILKMIVEEDEDEQEDPISFTDWINEMVYSRKDRKKLPATKLKAVVLKKRPPTEKLQKEEKEKTTPNKRKRT